MSPTNKFEYYEYMKSNLENSGFTVEEYKEINYGLQFNVAIQGKKHLVRVFESKKGIRHDLSQVKETSFQELIEESLREKSSTSLTTKTPSVYEVKTGLPQSFTVYDENTSNKIEDLLTSNGATKEDATLDHIKFFYILNGLRITFFTSSRILLQGKASKFSDDLLEQINQLIKDEHKRLFSQTIEEYFVDNSDFDKYVEEAQSDYHVETIGETYLGKELYNFLNTNDQIDLLDAISLFEYAQKEKIVFRNYGILVRNFAIVYEGFLIKIFIETNLLTEEDYEENGRTLIGKKLAEKQILQFVKNPSHNAYIASNLESVWQSHRNKNLHSDYVSPKIIADFAEAEHDINEVIKVMKNCFSLIDFEKVLVASVSNTNLPEITIKNVDMEKAFNRLFIDKFDFKHQKKANWMAQKGSVLIVNINNSDLKVIAPETELIKYKDYFNDDSQQINDPDELIGTDESGKGDFFGPLVVAGVYVNKETSLKLKSLGVMDSKKLSDAQIKLIANKIKQICHYSIVPIGNEKYNELYKKFNNLNTMLAWGHARAIENILEKVECSHALSDQFGDPELIKKALLKKGKTLKLDQRHRAEENIAVAAASILARDEFVTRLEQLSIKFGLKFPKGASTNTITIGKEFVQKTGEHNLNNIAKMHFKTTNQILGN